MSLANLAPKMTPAAWDRLSIDQRAQWMESTPGHRGHYPWLGVIGSVVGTLLALATIPEHPERQGALRIPALCMAIGFALAPVLAGLRDPRNFFRTENIIGACPIYWLMLDLIQGVSDLPTSSPASIFIAFGSIGTCTTFFWVGTLGNAWKLPQSFVNSCNLRPPTWALFSMTSVLFFLAMMAYALPCRFDVSLMIESLGRDRWSAPWTRGRLGDWDAFRDHMAYFGYLLPAFATMLAKRRGWLNPMAITAILMALIFLIFLGQGGARRLVGATLGAAVVYWVLDRPKVSFRQVFAGAGAVGAIIWVMQIMIYARNVGFEEAGNQAVYIATQNIEGKKMTLDQYNYIRVDDNFYRITNIATAIPKIHDFVGFEFIYYVLIRPIPRVIWKDKPIDPGYVITLLSSGGTLYSCTVVGDFYMSWGFPALALGGWLLGRAARLGSPLLYAATGTLAPLFYGYLTMWLFVGYRSLVEIVLFIYPLISWMAVVFLLRRQLGLVK